MTITELKKERLDSFFQYLGRHVSENGSDGTDPFLPLSRSQSKLSDRLRSKFEDGLNKDLGEQGWRRTWVALDHENTIIGHADIRSNDQLNAGHRVILGMGVDRDHRKQRVGLSLLVRIIDHCRTAPGISWIDLEVISTNTTARDLYDKMGFIQTGMTEDMFRIDGTSYDYVSMTLNVEEERGPNAGTPGTK